MRRLVNQCAITALAACGVILSAAISCSPAAARVGVFVGVGPVWGWPAPYYYAPPPVVYVPPSVYYAPPPVVVAPPAAPPQSWYYCDKPAGYYPYVTSCEAGWRQVPSQPPHG